MEMQGWEGMPAETFRRLTGVRKRTFAEMAAVVEHADAARKAKGGKPNRLAVETAADDAGILAGVPHVPPHRP